VLVAPGAQSIEPTPWPVEDLNSRILVCGASGTWSVLERIRRYSTDLTHVIVVSAAGGDRRLGDVLASTIAGDQPRLAVGRLVTSAPSLAVAAVGRRLQQVNASPSAAHAVLTTLLPTIPAGLWLRRVTKLDEPSPSVGQHLRSWFPGKGFWALLVPRSKVVNLNGAFPDYGSLREAVLTADTGIPQEALSVLTAALGTSEVVVTEPVHTIESVYGSTGGEFVVVPQRIAPPQLTGARCPSCDEHLHSPACPFCHVAPSVLAVPTTEGDHA